MEEDTPGQIFGLTSKNTSGKHTQRPSDDENLDYKDTDDTDTQKHRANKLDARFYFAAGILMVVVLFFASLQDITQSHLDSERDRTLAKQKKFDEA